MLESRRALANIFEKHLKKHWGRPLRGGARARVPPRLGKPFKNTLLKNTGADPWGGARAQVPPRLGKPFENTSGPDHADRACPANV